MVCPLATCFIGLSVVRVVKPCTLLLLSLWETSSADGDNSRHKVYEMTSAHTDVVKADIPLRVCVRVCGLEGKSVSRSIIIILRRTLFNLI